MGFKNLFAILALPLLMTACLNPDSGSSDVLSDIENDESKYPAYVGRWNGVQSYGDCSNDHTPFQYNGLGIAGGSWTFTRTTATLGLANSPDFTLHINENGESGILEGSHGFDFTWELVSPTIMLINYYAGCGYLFEKVPNYIPENADE